MAGDGELLQQYSRSGLDASFAELGRRHLDFVFSTAVRVANGDEDLAKDVSRDVFIDLARKASALSTRRSLTGWFYASACFAAAWLAATISKAVQGIRKRIALANSSF